MPFTFGVDHSGTLSQRLFFLPSVAAVDDFVRPSAVCAGGFSREDGGKGTELADDLDAVYQGGGINLTRR
jgi:hypothetical protein